MVQTFQIEEKVWLYPGKAGWYFVTIPAEITKEINFFFSQHKKGWGSLPVQVTLGKTTWATSIFPDSKTQTYLLPLKAAVRKIEHLNEKDTVRISLELKG